MATDKNKTKIVADEIDDDPTHEFEIPVALRHKADIPAPEIELDENTYDIDEPTDPSVNLSKSELKASVRAQAGKIDELEYELEQLTSRNRGLSEELKAREEIANALNDESSRAKDALQRADSDLRSHNEDQELLRSELDRTNERASALELQNTELQEQFETSKSQADTLKSQLDEKDREVRQLERELRAERHTGETREASDREDDQHVDELQGQLDSAKIELPDLGNYVDHRKAGRGARDFDQTEPTARETSDNDRSAELSEEVSLLTAELASARARIDDNLQKIKQQKLAANELRNENRKLKRALTAKSGDELEDLRQLSARQVGQVSEMRREATRLDRENQQLESYADALRMQVQDQISTAKASAAVRAKLEKGLDIAEGRNREMGSELRKARSQLDKLLGELGSIREDHEREIRQIRFELGTAQETLADQETVNQQMASDLVDQQSYTQTLETKLDESEQQRRLSVHELTEQLESARSDAEEFERKLQIKDAEIADLMKQIADAGSDLELKSDVDGGLHGIEGFKPGGDARSPRQFEKDKLARLLIGNADGRELRFPLFKDRLTIGRTSLNDIQLNMQFISRRHAVIATDNGKTRVIDWGSKNGVYVNKVRVSEKILDSGDVVTIGTTEFRYEERPKR